MSRLSTTGSPLPPSDFPLGCPAPLREGSLTLVFFLFSFVLTCWCLTRVLVDLLLFGFWTGQLWSSWINVLPMMQRLKHIVMICVFLFCICVCTCTYMWVHMCVGACMYWCACKCVFTCVEAEDKLKCYSGVICLALRQSLSLVWSSWVQLGQNQGSVCVCLLRAGSVSTTARPGFVSYEFWWSNQVFLLTRQTLRSLPHVYVF